MRKLIVLITFLLIFSFVWSFLEKNVTQLPNLLQKAPTLQIPSENVKVVTEESVTVDVVKTVGPSVVTVAEEVSPRVSNPYFDLGPFSVFGLPSQLDEEQEAPQEQNIGSGFIVSADGFIVTNKHVVADINGKYQIITNNDKKYEVQRIYRDPLNDIAILKIDPSKYSAETLKPVTMGDSSKLQVGQFAIAIGTALGEFRNTVTTGVISGLGRGITAGNEYQGYIERLDNVIQTNAAINPGNSGGPLLNSAGQVIGVNTAVASGGQNIGFALPINVIKDSLKNFNETGQFNRPYFGVTYKIISRDLAIMNNLPEGAYVQKVIKDSPAEKAGVKNGDIILKINGEKINAANKELAGTIARKKVGDTVAISLWRADTSSDLSEGKIMEVKAVLEPAPNQ